MHFTGIMILKISLFIALLQNSLASDTFMDNGMLARHFLPFFGPSFSMYSIPFMSNSSMVLSTMSTENSSGGMTSSNTSTSTTDGPAGTVVRSSKGSSHGSSMFTYKETDSKGNSFDIEKDSEDRGSITTIKIGVKEAPNPTSAMIVNESKQKDVKLEKSNVTYARKIEQKGKDDVKDELDENQSREIDNILDELINATKANSGEFKTDMSAGFGLSSLENIGKELDEADEKRKKQKEKVCKILQKLLKFTE